MIWIFFLIHFPQVLVKTVLILHSALILLCGALVFLFIRLFMMNKQLRKDKSYLKKREELFKAIFTQSPVGVIFGNQEKKIVDVNPMFERITERSKKEILTLDWREYTHPDDIELEEDLFNKFQNNEIVEYNIIKRYIRPDGSVIWVNMNLAPLELTESDINHIAIVQDVTERILLDQALKESERSKSTLLKNLPGMAYRCNFDRDWTMQFVSEGCYELTGYKPESLLYNRDLSYNDLISPDYQEYLWNKWNEVLKQKLVFKDEYEIITADGSVKWVYEQGCGVYDESDNIIAIEGLIIDITQQKRREERIRYLNNHDLLTGLYNRKYFEEEIQRIDKEQFLPISLIIGDINGLKLINEAYGTDTGDQLLKKVANILKSFCRTEDILTRLGGDEFSIILPKTTLDEARELIKKIDEACQKENITFSLSLGCATKTNKYDLISNTIKDAEDNMLLNKLLQSHSFHSNLIASLKATLYAKSQETEEHAKRLIK